MRTLLAILIALGCLTAVVYIAGRMQPEQHLATQSALIAASPSAVWTRINAVEDEPRWRKSVKSVTPEASVEGHPCYTENARFPMKLCVQRTDGERLRVVSVADPNQRVTGTWTFLVQPGNPTEPNGNTTRLTITEDAAVHPALLRGVMVLTGMDRGIRQYLASLSNSFAGTPEQS